MQFPSAQVREHDLCVLQIAEPLNPVIALATSTLPTRTMSCGGHNCAAPPPDADHRGLTFAESRLPHESPGELCQHSSYVSLLSACLVCLLTFRM